MGNDVLYNGNLESECDVELYSIGVDGVVTSNLRLKTKDANGYTTTTDLGPVFRSDIVQQGDLLGLNPIPDRYIEGEIRDGLVVDRLLNPSTAILLKDIDGPKNYLNAVWMPIENWKSNITYQQDVGTINTSTIQPGVVINGTWVNSPELDLPGMLKMTPITDDSGQVYAYSVKANDDDIEGEYVICEYNKRKYLHFVARGRGMKSRYERYVVDFDAMTVSRFKFNEIHATNVQFSTIYQVEKLRNDLVSNYLQYALNKVVYAMLTNSKNSPSPIELASGLHLDMFSDQTTLDNYIVAGYPSPDGEAQGKFQQVFKNHTFDIGDDGPIEHGFVYKKFSDKMGSVFGDANAISLVDGSSIKVNRVSNRDEFTYEVLFDIYLNQNKNLLESLYDGAPTSNYERKYLLANAVVKDVKCTFKSIPHFTSDSNTELVYDVSYTVDRGTYNVEYNKIVYAYNGKVKVVSLPETKYTAYTIDYDISIDKAGEPLAKLRTEIVLDKLGELLGSEVVCSMFKGINNGLPEPSSEVIDYIVKVNTQEDGGIWQLDKMEPSSALPSGSKLMFKDYGNVLLDGNIYDVQYVSSTKKPYLKKRYGTETINILDHSVFGQSNKYVIEYTGNNNDSSISNVLYLDSGSSPAEIKYTQDPRNSAFDQEIDAQNFLVSVIGEADRKYYVLKPHRFSGTQPKTMGGHFATYPNNAAYRVVEQTYLEDNFEFGTLNNITTDGRNMVFLKAKPGKISQPSVSVVSIPRWQPTEDNPTGTYGLSNYQETVNSQGDGWFEYVVEDEAYMNFLVLNEHETEDTTIDMGDNLMEGSDFTVQVDGDVESADFGDSREVDVHFSGYEESTNENWFGTVGKFHIKFTVVRTNGQVVVTANTTDTSPCYQLEDIPDGRRDLYTSDVQVYEPQMQSGIQVDYDVFDGEGEGSKYTSFKFTIKAKVLQRKLILGDLDGYSYINGNYLVDKTTNNSVHFVVGLGDLNNNISTTALNYAIARIPTDIGTNTSCIFDNHELSEAVYIPIRVDSGGIAFNGPAIKAPVPLRVVDPTVGGTLYGDILNRHYEVQTEISAEICKPDNWASATTWQDATSIQKSVRAIETNHKWEELIYNGGYIDNEIPSLTRDRVVELVRQNEKLEKGYFEGALLKLHDFLAKIESEIGIGSMKGDVQEMCRISYDATPTFNNHSSNRNDWNRESGLFGYNRGPHTLYENSVSNLNQYLQNEFSSDYRRLVVDIDRDKYLARGYHNIVDGE